MTIRDDEQTIIFEEGRKNLIRGVINLTLEGCIRLINSNIENLEKDKDRYSNKEYLNGYINGMKDSIKQVETIMKEGPIIYDK